MWYRGSVTIPADTAKADYAIANVPVCPGQVVKFYRLFAPGCSGMVHLQVFHQTRQIFPTTPGESYIGDGSEILGDATIELDEPPYILQLRGWSPDTDYSHTVAVEFYIEKGLLKIPVPLAFAPAVLPGVTVEGE